MQRAAPFGGDCVAGGRSSSARSPITTVKALSAPSRRWIRSIVAPTRLARPDLTLADRARLPCYAGEEEVVVHALEVTGR